MVSGGLTPINIFNLIRTDIIWEWQLTHRGGLTPFNVFNLIKSSLYLGVAAHSY